MKVTNINGLESSFTYEFVTRHTPSDLIKQYFSLRQKVYTEYWQLKNFSGGEDNYDKIGHILLTLKGKECVGGIRLITHKAGSSIMLPMEEENFELQKLFPELNLRGKAYGEIGRAIMLPECMDGKHSREMYRLICLKSKELNHHYAFAVAPVVSARKYRIVTGSFGLKTEIRKDVPIPASPSYENIPMHLIIMNMNSWDIISHQIKTTHAISELNYV
jgi:hypothetical protein